MKIKNFKKGQGAVHQARGMSLVELMVAMFIGVIILTGIAVIFMTSSRSFVAIGNYIEMDRSSRAALDRMTRDIRASRDIISFSPTQIALNYTGSNQLVYAWDQAKGELTEWKSGGQTNVLLTSCDTLKFSMYKNIPLAGGTNALTTKPAEGKAIGVGWTCSRNILGKKLNTEEMQQAVIVIRNKQIL